MEEKCIDRYQILLKPLLDFKRHKKNEAYKR